MQWSAVVWIASLHLGRLAAPFCFTWYGLWLALGLSWVTGGLGVCLGYHRLLTHSSFETFRPDPRVAGIVRHARRRRAADHVGFGSSQASPLQRRRKRPAFAERRRLVEPHAVDVSALRLAVLAQLYRQYSPDLLKEPFLRMLDRTFLWWHLALGLILFTSGWLLWDVRTGLSFLVYGMFVRLIYVLHVTWAVNSASHIWGYRNYPTRDNSRNLWWVGLLAFGEGWHNNHHAYPRSAPHGHRWWEIDMTYWVICLMRLTGLAWNVSQPPVASALDLEGVPQGSDEAVIPASLSNPNSEITTQVSVPIGPSSGAM